MQEYGIPTLAFVSESLDFYLHSVELMSGPARGHPCPRRHA